VDGFLFLIIPLVSRVKQGFIFVFFHQGFPFSGTHLGLDIVWKKNDLMLKFTNFSCFQFAC